MTISREQALELLTDYHEQRLSPELCRELEVHIANNTLTKHVLETYKKTVVLCRECLKHREAPPDFSSRLLAYLRENIVAKGAQSSPPKIEKSRSI